MSTMEQQSDEQQLERSMAQLVSDLSEQTARLVRTEARLAAREMATKARQAGFGTGAFVAAGALAAYAVAMLLACLALALALVLPGWLATLLIGIGLALAAGLAALIGRAQLRKAMPPTPDETIARVREDIDVVRERTQS